MSVTTPVSDAVRATVARLREEVSMLHAELPRNGLVVAIEAFTTGHKRFEAAARPGDTALHRTDTGVEHLRRFLVRKTTGAYEDKRLALVGRQHLQGGHELAKLQPRGMGRLLDQPREIDGAEQAGPVGRQRLLAARIGG